MPGLTHTLEIARRAMLAHQSVLGVISHNVANANSPGYTRQAARLEPDRPMLWGTHNWGNGVIVDAIERKRDIFLDKEIRGEISNLGHWETKTKVLDRIEEIFNEPSDTGLSAALDAFWTAWSELSSNPEDRALRVALRERARTLTERFRGVVVSLRELGEDADADMEVRVGEFNSYLRVLAELNVKIPEAQLRGHNANDLRDQRDLLLDKMSQLARITYSEDEDGVLKVRLGGIVILDRNVVRELEVVSERAEGGSWRKTVRLPDGFTTNIEDGAIGAILDLRHQTIPELEQEISVLARDLAQHVNQIHRKGPSGVDFFQGESAWDISVSPKIEADPMAINVSTSGLSGDNDIALAIAGLRDERIIDGGTLTPTEYWNGFIARLGTINQEARFQEETAMSLKEALEFRRQSAMGVSLDEEMAEMVRTQHAFVAAARLFAMAHDMIQVLFEI